MATITCGGGNNRANGAAVCTEMKARSLAAMILVAGCVAAAEAKAPRAARSVHLAYAAPPSLEFYNEVTVRQSTPGSYFMVCGFANGYFGIQEKGDGKKVGLFSVWDPTVGNDPKKVAEKRVEVLFAGEGVAIQRFGGEGTGGGRRRFRLAGRSGVLIGFL